MSHIKIREDLLVAREYNSISLTLMDIILYAWLEQKYKASSDITQKDIADAMGASRVTINTSLENLEKAGMITSVEKELVGFCKQKYYIANKLKE